MRIEDPEGRTYHGRVGNMIYYTRNGKTYARRASTPAKAGKKQQRTKRQRALSVRFTAMALLYERYRRAVSPEIWRAAARELGKMAHNLFHAANYGCLDGEGQMADAESFQFSAGSLLLPREMRVDSLGGGRFRVTWTEERDGSTTAASDRLRAGVLYDELTLFPMRAREATGIRGDGGGEFLLDSTKGRSAHVYLYFEREDGTAWSPSRHFRVEWPD